MDRKRKIVYNTLILAVGNFGSKILAYIMVLVYTHCINKFDLGYYDLVITTISMIQPIALMAFDEGVYRWLIGYEKTEKKLIISTCLKATIFNSGCCVALLCLLNLKFQFRDVMLIAFFFVTSMLYLMILNALRGLTNNKLYAVSGVLNTFLILLFEIIGLILFSMGIEALLISKILANFLTILFIYFKEPMFRGISKLSFDKRIAMNVFKYSIPLVPNQVSWWAVNSSDRYIVAGFLGAGFNGIYSISNKFPTLITTITSIVYFALQETIIKEYSSDDRDEFYSKTFKKYYVMLFTLVCCAIPATKLIINWFVDIEYNDAWRYTGFLYLSTVFSALSSFLGIGYQISKETKRSIFSTVSAAGINIMINILLIQMIGLHAASFSTFIAYFVLFVIRIFHSKKYFAITINWGYFGVLLMETIGVIYVSYIGNQTVNMGLTLCTLIYLGVMNNSIIKEVLKKRGL